MCAIIEINTSSVFFKEILDFFHSCAIQVEYVITNKSF